MTTSLYYENYPQNISNPSKYIGILVHGGGGAIWNQKSKPYSLLSSLEICSTIYSITIPCHAQNIASDPSIHRGTTIQHLKQFSNTIKLLSINNKKIILICFSLGASFIIKLWNKTIKAIINYNESILIIIGCLPWNNNNQFHSNTKTWNYLWTPNIIKQLKWDKKMSKIHGKNWDKMALSVRQWFLGTDLTFKNENEFNKFIRDDRIFYIMGEFENVFPLSSLLIAMKNDSKRIAKHITVITCCHFSYFDKVGWKYTSKAIENILNNYVINKRPSVPIIGDALAMNINKIVKKGNYALTSKL